MASSAELAEDTVSVALIGRPDEARTQLQTALVEFGAAVVFEGEPSDLDLAALRASAPGVVIVNLDPGIEDALDGLQPVLDDPDVNVIFNEAEVTRQLGGWDLARWARHLAAKVLGHGDTNPPLPANAERLPGQEFLPGQELMPRPGAPPTPEQLAGERMIEEFTVEADDHADAIPTDYLPMEVQRPAQDAQDEAADFDLDISAIEGALATGPERPEFAPSGVPDNESASDGDAPLDLDIDLSVLDAALSAPPQASEQAPARSDAELLDEALGGLNLDLVVDDGEAGGDEAGMAPGGDAGLEFAAAAADDSAQESLDVGSLDADAPVSFAEFGDEETSFELDDDVAELAAQLDAMQDSAPPMAEVVQDLEFSLDEAAAGLDGAPEAASEPAREPAMDPAAMADDAAQATDAGEPAADPAGGFDFSDLSLAPMDDADDSAAPTEVAPATAAASEPAAEEYAFGGMDLALEPLDEGADEAAESATDAIQRVVVLGSSIGGPDALRTFLSGIPKGFPALFLLAQHLDSGFFERLAQQLQKSSKLPVRVADAESPAVQGEVLVIPSGSRIEVHPDGTIDAEPHGEAPKYKPCIDDVLRDVADRFGERATAIIFSGMAGDAIEGSVYLSGRRGEVWAQTADSCVVSSMVDGATARGVVEFTGTPRELAEHCVKRYGA